MLPMPRRKKKNVFTINKYCSDVEESQGSSVMLAALSQMHQDQHSSLV